MRKKGRNKGKKKKRENPQKAVQKGNPNIKRALKTH